MGSLFSSSMSGVNGGVDSSSSSQVQGFHSSREWKNHFNSLKNSPTLMVIDFTATRCGPCKFMEPTFIDFANKYNDVVFVKIDVDELSARKHK